MAKQFTISKSIVFKMAHALIKKFALSLSEALKQAWKACKLKKTLHLESEVRFSFVKADGSIREAVGTLKAGAFEYTPAKAGKPYTASLLAVPYFDVEKQAFRSFSVINLI